MHECTECPVTNFECGVKPENETLRSENEQLRGVVEDYCKMVDKASGAVEFSSKALTKLIQENKRLEAALKKCEADAGDVNMIGAIVQDALTDKEWITEGLIEPRPALSEMEVWRKGCNYMVSHKGAMCMKCGHPHTDKLPGDYWMHMVGIKL